MRLVSLVLCAALLAVALTVAPAASAGHSGRALIRQVNALRAEHGLDPLRSSRPLARASRRHARRIARTGRPHHGNLHPHSRRFRRVGEVIEWHEGGARVQATIATWRGSRAHRRLLLDPDLEYIGVGRAVGKIRGSRCSIWVARLGAR